MTLNHYVNQQPFDPYQSETSEGQEKFYQASQWRIIWWRFRQHKLALISGLFLLFMYIAICMTEFLAPYNLHTRHIDFIYAPPQSIHLFHEGQFIGPFTYGYRYSLNMENLKRDYKRDNTIIHKIQFFCRGDSYKLWGFIDSNWHFICPEPSNDKATLFLLGTDRLGRDMLSRIIYGARISLTVGLIGVTISFLLGLFIGGIAGYYGGWVDTISQRLIEIIQCLPQVPLWLALSAIIPITWSPILVFFGISVILGFLDWTGLARAVRSKFLSLREEDFCTAAQLLGAKPKRIITRHLLPNFSSHLIASITLSIPSMILGETALSFLGLGLRPPITSWGVLLTEAQNMNAVALYPWLLLPAVPVILVVLAFNFFGDGLRDVADPYKTH
ncbi:MAG: ABC transporter permease [Alphaproteobacteria bacterium]|nr:ABC transporter permease [Alphaproteobacteria bacterium]